ncbi:MAG: hypothetical protein HY094_07040 [Candidatus Melainabacteria bacterium]|nr:hypothetical protein [Candidatus Melainabacteria bacterium]
MSNSINSCLDRFHKKYHQDFYTPINPDAFSEVASNDDYESIGFTGFGNKYQSEAEKEIWADETSKLAHKSVYFHIAELPLKLISYMTYSLDNWWSRGFSALDTLANAFASMFRNKIYARDDDNYGAIKKAKEEFGDTKTEWLTKWNIFLQTKVKFLLPVLSLINPDLAFDIDSGVLGAIDSSWFRKHSLHSGFYPGIVQDLLNKWFGSKNNGAGKEHPPEWKLVRQQFKKHSSKAHIWWEKYINATPEHKEKNLLTFCKYMDQVTSIIVPFICLPSNLVGDTVRPILRRLNLSGPLRTFIRTLSAADRSLLGINYVFRFFIPEHIAEKRLEKLKNPNDNDTFKLSNFKFSYLYLGSLVGDILDFPLILCENKIKELHPFIQHSVEIMRIFKDWAFNTFWSGRRIRAAGTVKSKLSLDKAQEENNVNNISASNKLNSPNSNSAVDS